MNPPTLLLGDCIEQMQFWLPDNSVDAIVTDPPYGLSFMGKKWDYDVPQVAVWAECLRVLKPGGYLLAFAGTRTQHRMCVNIEDAGFEIRDMIAWLYGCLDAATEVLTRRGWINYRELTDGDEVLQWSHADGTLSWVAPSAVHEYPFDGDMVVLENRHTRQVLTPNHRVYAKVRRHSRNDKAQHYEVLDAAGLFDRPSNWQVDLPMAGMLKGGTAIDPDYAYLVGWWLTDAWAHGDGKACMFSQCKPATLSKLQAALAPWGASEYVRDRGNPNHAAEHTFYLAGPMADRLRAEFPDRVLPWDVLGWSEVARRALYEGLMDGDGSRNKDGQHAEAFWSQDAQRRGVFMALALSLGIRAFETPANAVVNVNPTTCTTQIQNKHRPAKLHYTGMVWCVTVPNGAFVVRRDGRPFITGNSGFPKSLDVSKAIGGKDFEAARQWQGWGTALKPSLEPITVARKPLGEKTVADNVLRWGTGGLNIDGCRVEYTDSADMDRARVPQPSFNTTGEIYNMKTGSGRNGSVFDPSGGRWPANLIHDGSDEALSFFPDAKGQLADVSTTAPSDKTSNVYGKMRREGEPSADSDNEGVVGFKMKPGARRLDSGSAARFYYCAKASKADRNSGLDGKPVLTSGHPTVKPADLMRYLCRLVTQPGGVVLDPFMGSGSTGKAARLEGFDFIGIERDPDYMRIAEARIK